VTEENREEPRAGQSVLAPDTNWTASYSYKKLW